MPKAQVLRPPQAARYLGVSLRQFYNIAERDPKFPRKIVYSSRCVGWHRQSLDSWLRSKEGVEGGCK